MCVGEVGNVIRQDTALRKLFQIDMAMKGRRTMFMVKCEWCGETFDKQDAEYEFDSTIIGLSYEKVRTCLCGKCSIEAIEHEVDGVYYENCEECGKEFDLMEESGKFDSNFGWSSGTTLRDFWRDGIVCCDCAMKILDSE